MSKLTLMPLYNAPPSNDHRYLQHVYFLTSSQALMVLPPYRETLTFILGRELTEVEEAQLNAAIKAVSNDPS